MIDAIIFDMDGVLFDTERIGCQCWEEVSRQMGLGDLNEGMMGCMGLNNQDAELLMKRLYGEDFPYQDYRSAVRALIKEKLSKEGLPLKEGVREILEYVAEKKYLVGLASSTSEESVMSHLAQAGLTKYFQTIITGDMVEHSKPLPDIYLKACAELGVLPSKAMAVEDSLNGIRSAYRAGMKPVMIPDLVEPTPEIEAMLYARCKSLLEVKAYL